MTSKKVVKVCESSLCCKATAELKLNVAKDLEKEDKSLGELLDGKEQRERKHK